MPWPNNYLPKYRKHRTSSQAVVTLNGRDFYLGPHGTEASKIEYDRLIGEWLANRRQPLDVSAVEITIVELCARYFRFAKGYYQKNGRCTRVIPRIRCALRYLRERYGEQPAAEFGPLALKALREKMVSDDLSRRYTNDHVDRIKRMFKWAVGEQLVPPVTYQALATVTGLRRERTDAREMAPIEPVVDADLTPVKSTSACERIKPGL